MQNADGVGLIFVENTFISLGKSTKIAASRLSELLFVALICVKFFDRALPQIPSLLPSIAVFI